MIAYSKYSWTENGWFLVKTIMQTPSKGQPDTITAFAFGRIPGCRPGRENWGLRKNFSIPAWRSGLSAPAKFIITRYPIIYPIH